MSERILPTGLILPEVIPVDNEVKAHEPSGMDADLWIVAQLAEEVASRLPDKKINNHFLELRLPNVQGILHVSISQGTEIKSITITRGDELSQLDGIVGNVSDATIIYDPKKLTSFNLFQRATALAKFTPTLVRDYGIIVRPEATYGWLRGKNLTPIATMPFEINPIANGVQALELVKLANPFQPPRLLNGE